MTVDGWPSSADPSPEKPPQAEGFSPGEKAIVDPSPTKPQQAEGSGRGMDRGDPETPEKASDVTPTKSDGRGPRKRTRSRSVPRFATPTRQLPGDFLYIDIRRTITLRRIAASSIRAAAGGLISIMVYAIFSGHTEQFCSSIIVNSDSS